MFRIRSLLALLIALGLTAWPVMADPGAKPTETTVEPQPKPGWIVIEEDVWFRFDDEPTLYMHQAHKSFLKKEYQATARELRKAGGYLHVAAKNASSDTKAALTASALELDRLAADIHDGTVKSVKSLESAFARAERALAADDHAKAKSALSHDHHPKAGHYLSSAVTHVENAAKWSGQKLESGAIATAKGVRTVAEKLREGGGAVVDEAGKGITWIGAEVQRLGKVIEPDRTPTAESKPVEK